MHSHHTSSLAVLMALSLAVTSLHAAPPVHAPPAPPDGSLQASMAPSHAGAGMGAIAQKLNDPTALLISLPFQNNFDWGAGKDGDGFQYKLNVQPVIPINLNDDWKIIWRTILPFITQEDVIGTSDQTGHGDLNTTIWFSPQKKREGQPTIGLGPILQFPTATDDLHDHGRVDAEAHGEIATAGNSASLKPDFVTTLEPPAAARCSVCFQSMHL